MKIMHEPDPKLLESMALRLDHSFGILPPDRQRELLNDARRCWDEVMGYGFYQAPRLECAQPATREFDPEPTGEIKYLHCKVSLASDRPKLCDACFMALMDGGECRNYPCKHEQPQTEGKQL